MRSAGSARDPPTPRVNKAKFGHDETAGAAQKSIRKLISLYVVSWIFPHQGCLINAKPKRPSEDCRTIPQTLFPSLAVFFLGKNLAGWMNNVEISRDFAARGKKSSSALLSPERLAASESYVMMTAIFLRKLKSVCLFIWNCRWWIISVLYRPSCAQIFRHVSQPPHGVSFYLATNTCGPISQISNFA